jgi:iron complex outermembrane receptor protein
MRFFSLPSGVMALGLAAALAAGAAPAAARTPDAGVVSGRVTTPAGTPIPDVQVSLAELHRSATTDSAGHYSIGNVPAGSYTLTFLRIGYAPVVRRIVSTGGDVTTDVPMRESIIELTGIQVTATANATSALNSPQPTSVVAGDELRAAQSPTLGETLAGVAGVHSLSTGVGIGKPVIRGLTSNRVLVLDDGQRLETQQWGDEHSPNIETATAERIEVIRGPASVLYGSDALGGVINVVQRDLPDAIAGAGFVHGSLSAAYGTGNRQQDGAASVEGASGSVGFRGALSGRTSGNVQTPDYVLWHSGNRAVGGNASLGTRGEWGSVVGSFSQRNERIQLTDEDPAAQPTQRMATSHGRVDLTLPLGANRLEISTGYERSRRREFEDDTTTTVALGLLSQTYLADVHFHHAALGPLSGLIGFSGMRNTFDKFGEETLIPPSRANNIGVYAFEQTEGQRINWSFGARYDYRRLNVDADTVLGLAQQQRTWNSVTGNIGLLYHVSEPVALVLNVGRGFRAPSSFDLYSNGVHEGTVAFERGNPNLRTEKSINTDLALRIQNARLSFEVGTFLNLIQDYIYTVPTGTTDSASGFEIFDVTQGDARLSGLEAAMQWHPTAYLHLQGTADYVRGENTTTNQPLPSMPPFRATWTARLEGGRVGSLQNLYFSVGGETNARQTRLDPAEQQFYADAFGGAGYQSQPYTLLHLGAGLGLTMGARTLNLDLSLRNALNERYADYLSRIKTNAPNPGQGRTLIARVSTDF